MRSVAKKALWRLLYVLQRLADPVVGYRQAAVLCYHSVSDSDFFTDITPAAFESHMQELRHQGYAFVPLQNIVAWVEKKQALPRKAVALTFDDGYADFATTVAPLLQKHGIPATVFVVGDAGSGTTELGSDLPFVSQADIELLKANPLIGVGYHSKTHPNLAKCAESQLAEEVAPHYGARYFAYPGGNHSPQAAEALRAAGYEAAFTIRPVLIRQGMNRYFLPRVVVTKGMSASEVALRASKAADWYYWLTRAWKK